MSYKLRVFGFQIHFLKQTKNQAKLFNIKATRKCRIGAFTAQSASPWAVVWSTLTCPAPPHPCGLTGPGQLAGFCCVLKKFDWWTKTVPPVINQVKSCLFVSSNCLGLSSVSNSRFPLVINLCLKEKRQAGTGGGSIWMQVMLSQLLRSHFCYLPTP